MRTYVFGSDEKSAERFQLWYQGFLLGAPEGGIRGLDNLLRATRVLEKLQSISEPLLLPGPDGAPSPAQYHTGDGARQLLPEGGEISLDITEQSMLKAHMDATPWRPGLAPSVVDAYEFIATGS